MEAPDEAPPWEDMVPPPEPEPEPVQSTAIPASDEAAALWDAIKKKIMEKNPMVYFYVKETRGVSLENGVLTVEFPATQESMLNGMRSPRNMQIAKEAAETVRPGTEPVFRLAALLNANEEKLKELFGSSLTIK